MFKKILLVSSISALTVGASLSHANSDVFNARQMALGGTSVASGDYSGVKENPALLSSFHESDDFGANLSVGIEASDPDDFVSAVEDVQSEIDNIESKGSSATLGDGEALIDSLRELDERGVTVKAGGGSQISIPMEKYGIALVGSTTLRLGGMFDYDPSDDESKIASNIAFNNGDMSNLESSVNVSGVGVTEVGLALSYTFDEYDLSVGFTPKYQRIDIIQYSQKVGDFESTDFDIDEYRNEKSAVNADIGVMKYFGDTNEYRVGASVLNLSPVDVKSPLGEEFNLRPVPVIGGGYDNGWLATTVEIDLKERAGFDQIADVQFAKVGFEIDVFKQAQLRLGYRDAINGGEEDVITAGFGVSPFDVIHLDIAGIYGSNSTYGGSIEFGMKL